MPNRTHDYNRCATCQNRRIDRVDLLTGARMCYSEAVLEDDLICLNWVRGKYIFHDPFKPLDYDQIGGQDNG